MDCTPGAKCSLILGSGHGGNSGCRYCLGYIRKALLSHMLVTITGVRTVESQIRSTPMLPESSIVVTCQNHKPLSVSCSVRYHHMNKIVGNIKDARLALK
jgi:hypothetical protein